VKVCFVPGCRSRAVYRDTTRACLFQTSNRRNGLKNSTTVMETIETRCSWRSESVGRFICSTCFSAKSALLSVPGSFSLMKLLCHWFSLRQKILPKLPVPSIDETIAKFLPTALPLCQWVIFLCRRHLLMKSSRTERVSVLCLTLKEQKTRRMRLRRRVLSLQSMLNLFNTGCTKDAALTWATPAGSSSGGTRYGMVKYPKMHYDQNF